MNFGTLKVFAGSSHPKFVEDICANLGLPAGQREIVEFSNQNIMAKISENVRGDDVYVVQTMAPPVNYHIMEALIMIDALRGASASRITAVLPYFPYARSDKKDQPRISITARLVADLFETAGADRVLTMNLHCAQIQGFLRMPSDQLIGGPVISQHLRKSDLSNTVLVASDVGEVKDLTHYANRLDLPMAIIDKRRSGNDEKAKAHSVIGDVEGKDAILLDDEIASGGTMIEAIAFLIKNGVNSVRCGAVHGVLTKNAVQRLSETSLKEIVVCDTIPVPKEKYTDKLKVLTVAPMFADAIKRIHTGESISSMFD
jgi:ribose-phosphate pyrophosphokinase